MALKRKAAKAAHKHLPVLRHSERALSELRTRASTSINHISRVVERDPCLAFELFSAVNRDLKHAGRGPTSSIRRAVLLFGVARYLDHVKSYQALESHIQTSILRATLNHLGRSCTAARVSQALAIFRGGVNPEEAFSLAMVKDFDSYASHIVEGTEVAIDWRNARTLLPGLSLPAISGDPLHWCVDTGVRFASVCQFAWDPKALEPQVKQIANQLDKKPEYIEVELRRTILAVSRETKHFNDYPPARFAMQPGPNSPEPALLFAKPAEEKPVEQPAQTARQRMLNRLKPNRSQDKPDAPATTESPEYLLPEKQLAKISATLDKAFIDLEKLGAQKATRPRVLPFALTVMNKVLKIEHALFIAHPGNNQLIERLEIEGDETPKLVKREISLEDNPVLRKAISAPQARHLTAEQLALHEQLFDTKLKARLGENDAYSIPLQGKNKVVGVILARLDPNTTNDWSRHFELSCNLCDKLVQVLDASA